MFDVLIKGGTLVDGSGDAARPADVGLKDGKIAAVGPAVAGEAKTVVDAAGRTVAPGFIDPHTHFDVQLLWDGAAKPALEHGITAVVPGNCSLSLAPLKAKDRKALVGMFQQIEELPPEAFTQAFEWTWEDFAGYRAALEPNLSINVAPLVGHSVIRLWVMGADSQQRAATADEIAAMQDLLRESLDAGAVGMSTSFVDVDETGRPVPSRFAPFAELDALSAVLGERGGRMLQIVPEFYDTDITIARIDQLAELSLKHGIPTTFSPVFDSRFAPDTVARQMGRVEEQFARGARVWPQMQTRPIDISFSLLRPSLFFARLPRWVRILRQPLAARLAALEDPATVDQMLADLPDGGTAMLSDLVVRGGDAAPAELAGRTLGEIAAERGETPARALINLSLENGLDVAFIAASRGHDDTSRIGPMLAHRLMHIGASDGGAHIASFATYGDTGYLFSEFVRRAGALTLEAAVKKITSDTAEIWGLKERGLVREGYAGDVVVFDPKKIGRGEERPVFDMPGDGMRYVRDSVGVETVAVNGEIAWHGGAYTDARAGEICALN
jgi:N-acyl-D-aspartate/D-glutamate deacylase